MIPKALRKKTKSSSKIQNQKNIDLVPTLSEETNSVSIPLHDSSDDRSQSSSSSAPSVATRNPIIKKYSKDVHGSSMSMFARMSSTIADTLSEEEFGNQRNSLYNPNSVGQSCRVEHPVMCKRDIFVQNVSPLKGKKGGRKIAYKPVATTSPKESQTKEHNNRPIKVQESRDDNLSDKSENTTRIKNGDEKKMFFAKEKKKQPDEIENKSNDNLIIPSYSITGSMLFRKNNQLKIETGRIAESKSNVVSMNPYRLYNAPAEQHHGRTVKELGKPPRYTSAISPSSTVSSLTIPADLDDNQLTTPRSFLPQLENIEEFGDIIKSHDYETLKELGDAQEI